MRGQCAGRVSILRSNLSLSFKTRAFYMHFCTLAAQAHPHAPVRVGRALVRQRPPMPTNYKHFCARTLSRQCAGHVSGQRRNLSLCFETRARLGKRL